ncbi:M50 family metallopeptidase [Haliscomenobacter sp.]|uniref:M50 family metallopeptidase n=1 Tax=Haliscomenobacter sp. TaxID=2717303 RepID=UPI003364D957
MSKKRNKTVTILLGTLDGAALGFGLGYTAINWMPDFIAKNLSGSADIWWELPLKIVFLLVGLWAALAAHELGHLMTGLAQGFTFHLYVAGFLGVRRNPLNDQIEWYFNRDANLFGGVAATLPTQKSPDLRRKLAAIVIAGPITSLLGAVLVGLPAIWGIAQLTPDSSALLRILFTFLLVFGLTSFLLFLVTTIPSRTGAFFTDRVRFFRLVGGGKAAEIEQAMLELLAQSYTNQPFGEMNLAQIELIKSDQSELMQSFAYSLAYYYHLDRGENEQALAAIYDMEPLIAEQPLAFQVELLKDVAYAYARLAKDPLKARSAWNKAGKLGQAAKDAHALLTKTALCWIEGNEAEAKAYLQQGLAALPAKRTKYGDQFYFQQFKDLEQEMAE